MRPPVTYERVREFARALSRRVDDQLVIYLTGGATAVIEGWRESTIDIDPTRARELFRDVEDRLFRYPAVNAGALRRAIDEALGA